MLRAVGLGGAFAVPVTGLALLVRERVDAVLDLDEAAIAAATALTRDHPTLLRALLAWEEALQPRWVYLVASGVCLWVWRGRGRGTRAAWAFVTMMISWNVALDLKYVVQRARPVIADAVSHAPGYSFPSGHAANAAAAGTVLVLLLWPLLSSAKSRYAVLAAAALVIVLTAADRVFLGVHYPSDVVGGVLLGCGLAVASYLGYVGWNPASDPTDTEA